jgi:hypothetical protein
VQKLAFAILLFLVPFKFQLLGLKRQHQPQGQIRQAGALLFKPLGLPKCFFLMGLGKALHSIY